MPRYFFHLRYRTTLLEDEEGQELPDLEAAKAEALHALREIEEQTRRPPEAMLIYDDSKSELGTDRLVRPFISLNRAPKVRCRQLAGFIPLRAKKQRCEPVPRPRPRRHRRIAAPPRQPLRLHRR